MRVDAHTQMIWTVRSWLGARGHLALASNPVNPAHDSGLRRMLIVACNWDVSRRWPFADDRGLLNHVYPQLVDEPPQCVHTWDEVWQLISPGITAERAAALQAAWSHHRKAHTSEGLDPALHAAMCAFYQPAPIELTVQLDLLDLIGASHG